MKSVFACTAGLLILSTAVAVGQVIYNNASTAGESYANGMANVISSQGQKNLSDSQAAINLTQARNQQIDNQVKSVNAFWEKNDIYNERQQKEFAEIERKRNAYMATHALGYLTPQDFDRASGQVNWPRILIVEADYAPYRKMYDELLKKRAYVGALTGEEYLKLKTTSKEWRTLIASKKNEYPAQILEQIIRFVLKVDREVNDNLG